MELPLWRLTWSWVPKAASGVLMAAVDLVIMSSLFGPDEVIRRDPSVPWLLVALAGIQIPIYVLGGGYPGKSLGGLAAATTLISLTTTSRPLVLILGATARWATRGPSNREMFRAALGFLPLNAAWLFNETVRLPADESPGDLARVFLFVTVVHILLIGSAFAIGRTQMNHRIRLRSLEEEQQRAVESERQMIRHELHDIVANSIAVMTTAAGAAAVVDDPKSREYYLESIQQFGAAAGEELQRLLRAMDIDGALGIQDTKAPSFTKDGAAILERIELAGADIEMDVEGETQPIDYSVDVALYRTLQEGLTNFLKHGDTEKSVVVEIEWRQFEVRTRITNHLSPKVPARRRWRQQLGFGLTGLKERVHIVGGDLTIDRDGEIFSLTATLPTSNGLPDPLSMATTAPTNCQPSEVSL